MVASWWVDWLRYRPRPGAGHTQAKFAKQVCGLVVGNGGALEKPCVQQFHSAQIDLTQVSAVKTRQFEMGVAQTATLKEGVPEITARELSIGKVKLLQTLFAKRHLAKVGPDQQGVFECQAQAGYFLKIGASQFALLRCV